MRLIQLSAGLCAFFAIGCVSAASPAYAGGWRFEPSRCPDLVEDRRDRRESRRDERYDHGPLDRAEDRADRRESRRDERVAICPASAWVWDGPRSAHTARPAAVAIYYNLHDRHYFRYGPKRTRVRVVIR